MYCALNYELQNLPILSEYSHTKDGRIDFFIFQKKWGIEVLSGGSMSQIAEHAARFASGGRYREWNIFEDYIILSFCSKSTVRKIEIEDSEVQSRILQVAVDPKEYAGEVYTCDKQLLATLTLGEGRQRFEADKYDSTFDNSSVLGSMRNHIMQLQQENEEMRRQAEQEKEEMRRQLEQFKDDMKRQTRS